MLATTLVVAVVAAACSSSPSSASHSTTTSARATAAPSSTAVPGTPAAVPVRLAKGARYVALGSSFAAGPGIPQQSLPCARSNHNYASLVAQQLHLSLTDVSCSGATTADVLTTAQGSAPPQIDAVSADDALVTVTVGGNDIQYSAAAIECGATAARDKSCLPRLDRTTIAASEAALPGRLVTMLATIKQRAPHATVVLVTYPKVVPTEGAACAQLGLLPVDAAFIAAMGARLEADFLAAARTAQVRVADPYVRGDGHGPCAAANARWVEGAVPRSPGFPFHPNENGHVEMAALVTATLHAAS